MKHIQVRDRFLEKYKSNPNFQLIQEDSGPMGNDINWGDSLLGRLLASVYRAIEHGVNTKRIDGLLAQLDRAIKNKVIQELMDENEEVKTIVGTVETTAAKGALANVAQTKPEELKDYLEGLKESKGDEWFMAFFEALSEEFKAILEASIEHQEVGKEEGDGSGEVVADYEVMKQNLKYLSGMLNTFGSIKLPTDEPHQQQKPTEQTRPVTKQPANQPAAKALPAKTSTELAIHEEGFKYLLEMLALGTGDEDGKNLPAKQGENLPAKTGQQQDAKPGVKVINPGNQKARTSNINAEDVPFEDVPNEKPEQGKEGDVNVGKGETTLIEAYQNLKKSFDELTGTKFKGVGVTSELVNGMLKEDMDDARSKEEITALYKTIVGMLKSGSTKLNPLVKESVVLKGREIISEKIARYGARTLQFEGLNFYAALGDFGKNMQGFNDTLKKLMQSTTFEAAKKPEEKTQTAQTKPEEKTQESLITEKVSFLSKFFGVKVGDEAVNQIKVSGTGNTVNIFMDGKKLDDLRKLSGYDEGKSQIQDQLGGLEKKLGEQVKRTVEKSAIDLIEIIRIFNKANRIMVRNAIPSVRTGGRVDVRRANMWEMIDGSAVNVNSPGGPVRNIKLFQRWNDGVLKIIKENADILKNAEVIVDANGRTIKPKYPISKFISDSLNDNKLFQSYGGGSGGKGYQAQYLESFLGVSAEEAKTITGISDDDKSTKDEDEKDKPKTGKKYEVVKSIGVKDMDQHLYKATLAGGTIGKDAVEKLYLCGIKTDDDKNVTLFKVSTSDFFFKAYVKGYKPLEKATAPVYILTIYNNGKPLTPSSKIPTGKAVNVADTDTQIDIKDLKFKTLTSLVEDGAPIEKDLDTSKLDRESDRVIKNEIVDKLLRGLSRCDIRESVSHNLSSNEVPKLKKYSDFLKNETS